MTIRNDLYERTVSTGRRGFGFFSGFHSRKTDTHGSAFGRNMKNEKDG
jgi:hypothetical protein